MVDNKGDEVTPLIGPLLTSARMEIFTSKPYKLGIQAIVEYCNLPTTDRQRIVVVIMNCKLMIACMITSFLSYKFKKLSENHLIREDIQIIFKCDGAYGCSAVSCKMCLFEDNLTIRPTMLIVIKHLDMKKHNVLNHIKKYGRSARKIILVSKLYNRLPFAKTGLNAYKLKTI